ncbi:hypothetical protein UFOVP1279_4 [uncultured Caudovirales phage]|uniref:Uncharacterized protein n=1 Tax=uncultured Caudovirales phage TaxID=2100421 RepID=A0A6J5RFX7_9CAUD|nr:hypothetical protein UFOVP1279_4 [uncultured Caudovirales phage]
MALADNIITNYVANLDLEEALDYEEYIDDIAKKWGSPFSSTMRMKNGKSARPRMGHFAGKSPFGLKHKDRKAAALQHARGIKANNPSPHAAGSKMGQRRKVGIMRAKRQVAGLPAFDMGR